MNWIKYSEQKPDLGLSIIVKGERLSSPWRVRVEKDEEDKTVYVVNSNDIKTRKITNKEWKDILVPEDKIESWCILPIFDLEDYQDGDTVEWFNFKDKKPKPDDWVVLYGKSLNAGYYCNSIELFQYIRDTEIPTIKNFIFFRPMHDLIPPISKDDDNRALETAGFEKDDVFYWCKV